MNPSNSLNRRQFIGRVAATTSGLAAGAIRLGAAEGAQAEFRALFDGTTLSGWHAVPRLAPPADLMADAALGPDELAAAVARRAESQGHGAAVRHVGRWRVEDGAVIGGRDPVNSNLGCYLRSDEQFGDFELELEAHPDWPADTGIMIRCHELPNIGYQILLDHRPNGGIAGVYGNSLGAFIAAPFYVTGDEAPGFKVKNLRQGVKPATGSRPVPMQYGATFADFAGVWRLNDWNRFRIRCVGELPKVTTWVNGLKICELDIASVRSPGFSPEQARRLLGRKGHLAFEVHDAGKMGHDRWAEGAVCRWRNVRLKAL